MTDEELLGRLVMSPDRNAYEQLYERKKNWLWRSAMIQMGNRHDAEDVFNETWLKVWKYRENYGKISLRSATCSGQANGYLRRILNNTIIDWHRKQRAAKRGSETPLPFSFSFVSTDFWVQPLNAADRLEMNRTRELVLEIIGGLRDRQRRILFMRIEDHASYADIAVSEGISEAMARQEMSRARQRISQQLSPEVRAVLRDRGLKVRDES